MGDGSALYGGRRCVGVGRLAACCWWSAHTTAMRWQTKRVLCGWHKGGRRLHIEPPLQACGSPMRKRRAASRAETPPLRLSLSLPASHNRRWPLQARAPGKKAEACTAQAAARQERAKARKKGPQSPRRDLAARLGSPRGVRRPQLPLLLPLQLNHHAHGLARPHLVRPRHLRWNRRRNGSHRFNIVELGLGSSL